MNEIITWSPGVTLEMIEKQVILKAWAFYRGNKTTTSNALGIAIRTLDSKLEKYRAEEDEHEAAEARGLRDRETQLRRARGIHVADDVSYEAPAEGIRLESLTQAPAQQTMPMPQRPEVQTLLSRQPAAHHSGKRR